ncbi:polysaccharide biosynthesis protein [Bacillus sp. FJAT-29790]|nr:polysaccharide biosynthesis protein [Bacillus sp. FJAT-29790]
MPTASKTQITEIIILRKQTTAKLQILPRVQDLIDGKVSIKEIRDVNIKDLLGCEPVRISLPNITGYIDDKVVLVTGAVGSIGSELCQQICTFYPRSVLLLGYGENSIYSIELELKQKYSDINIEPLIADIKDLKRLERLFQTFRPQVIFHAAAHKHLPLMEKNSSEAVKNNIFGPKI